MIPYGQHHLDEEDIQAVVDVLRGGILTQGPVIEAFERAIADYVGVKYAVAVSSGTAALHLSALAAGVAPGNTLVTSPITFVASANAALYTGGNVAFADVDPDTINMSPDHLRAILQSRGNVRAVVPVHFAGLPCDMERIKGIADEHDAVVIEDAAHALGARYPDGRYVGCCAYSQMTIFSFHPVKAIAAGEGGMITTNDESIYRKLIRLRSHGINKLDDPMELPDQAETNGQRNPWYYEMQEIGYHYRITDIQCALALSQFRKLDKFIDRRKILAAQYDRALSVIHNIRPAQLTGRDISGHHLYPVRIDFNQIGVTRTRLMLELREIGIGTQVHYIPVPRHPYYRSLGFSPLDYPNSENYYAQALTLPLFYQLSDQQQLKLIATLERLLG